MVLCMLQMRYDYRYILHLPIHAKLKQFKTRTIIYLRNFIILS